MTDRRTVNDIQKRRDEINAELKNRKADKDSVSYIPDLYKPLFLQVIELLRKKL